MKASRRVGVICLLCVVTVFFTGCEDGGKTQFTVTYSTNDGALDGTAALSKSSETVKVGESVTLPTATSSPDDIGFLGFSTNKNATVDEVSLLPGSSYTPSNDVKLYAIWQSVAEEGTLSFADSEDGTTLTVNKDDSFTGGALAIPMSHDGEQVTVVGDFHEDQNTSMSKRLTSVSIPEGVTSIGEGAFSWCLKLTSVSLPNSLLSIGDTAFGGCANLTNITLPSSLTEIGSEAFAMCYNLENITLPSSLTTIGTNAFASSWLTSVTIPSSLTDWDYSFASSYLESVTFAEGLTTIAAHSFECCYSLTSVSIPESVTTIDTYAFNSCSSLESITLPAKLESIGGFAFSGCTSLSSITYLGTSTQWKGITRGTNWHYQFPDTTTQVYCAGDDTYVDLDATT